MSSENPNQDPPRPIEVRTTRDAARSAAPPTNPVPPHPQPPEPRRGSGGGRAGWVVAVILLAILAAVFLFPEKIQREQVARMGSLKPAQGSAPKSTPGPFAYRFTPGEELHYRLEGYAGGAGFDPAQSSGVSLVLGFDMTMTTDSVEPSGDGNLRLDFGDVVMTGQFMGSPVELYHSAKNTRMQLDERTRLDTAQGQSVQGIPQLELFGKPITMRVAPNGEVKEVRGVPGFDQLLEPAKLVSPVQFTDPEMVPGYTWTSDFKLPVPGIGAPATSHATNTFTGYEDHRGHRCGVIRQELASTQYGGQMNSPSSALGESMGFSMPTFELTGQNIIYFDVDTHKLVHADLDMRFNLEIGDELKPIASIIDAYTKILSEIEGAPSKQTASGGGTSLTGMGLNIRANLALVE